MNHPQFLAIQRDVACVVHGVDPGTHDGERAVIAALAVCFRDEGDVEVYSEPVIAGSDQRPDVLIVHPRLGVFVIEVKGYGIDNIEGHRAGVFQVSRDGRQDEVTPLKQADRALFALKNAVKDGATLRLERFAAFPHVRRGAWERKFGASAAVEAWFADDLEPAPLRSALERKSNPLPPGRLLEVRRALGDTSVLLAPARAARPAVQGTLGTHFDEVAVQEKRLSDEQRRLAHQDWRGGPRLIRGVAGSGKSVVLALQVARFAEREARQRALFPRDSTALVVCFNRSLVPFLQRKIEAAYRQLTGAALPPGRVRVVHLNALYFELSNHAKGAGSSGLWSYQRFEGTTDEERAARYLAELEATAARDRSRLELHRFDAIYVDEGQDFLEDEYRILSRLCAAPGQEPNLFVFYDDAQNIYGRPRPVWTQLGLQLVGRSTVMKECFRNTRQIVEPAFNVLLGAAAPPQTRAGTQGFADTSTLEEARVVSRQGDRWVVGFAERQGPPPQVLLRPGPDAEAEALAERIAWLVHDEQVRPDDLLVLGARKERLRELAAAVSRRLPDLPVFLTFEDEHRGDHLFRAGQLTFSTIQSAKGYDACYVLITSANQIATNREGRATFYVACTRARERLDVFAYEPTGLVGELATLLRA